MNILEHYVTEILSEPRECKYEDHKGEEVSVWILDIKSVCYGRTQETYLTFDTKEEAENIQIGHIYMA